jgi:transcriptional regulator with GAF, ATPase, and Fis domain
MSELEECRRRCRRLEVLHGLARELLRQDDRERLLDALMTHALAGLCAERGFLVLLEGEQLQFKIVRNWSRSELEKQSEPVSKSILEAVLREGAPLLVDDPLSDPRFSHRASVLDLQIRSVLAAPLEVDGATVGALYLESRDPEVLFGPPELELFGQMLELASGALHTALQRLMLERRSAALEKDFLARHRFPGIVTRDLGLLRLLETVAQVADSELPVLVEGPSGSGKELISRALHLNSSRSRGPFVTVNCGAISPALLESELFGHVKGAFTGAVASRAGLIRAADGGTVFLDEVGELPLELQAKLLRTLQFGEVQPVGSAQALTADVRFVAATNRDLERMVSEGSFREDLYYRLNAITLQLPALRQRPDDVLPLFYHFLEQAAEKARRAVPEVARSLEQALQQYEWPGNVRELENEARRLLAVTPPGAALDVERLSSRIRAALGVAGAAQTPEQREKERIELHLRLAGGNRTHAARSLGISRETLRQRMKRHGLK